MIIIFALECVVLLWVCCYQEVRSRVGDQEAVSIPEEAPLSRCTLINQLGQTKKNDQ